MAKRTIEQTQMARLKEIEAEENGDEIEAVEPEEEAAEVEETEGAEPDEEVSEEQPEDGARARDDKGRFAPKQNTAPPEGGEGNSATTQAPDTATAQPVEAPASWSAEDKTLFTKLPQDVQATLARREKEREADYTRKTQAVAHWSDLDKRYGMHAGQMGMTTAQLADQLFQTRNVLLTGSPEQKRHVLQQIAQGFGVELTPAAQPQGSAQPINQLPADPALQAVAQVRQEFASLQSSIQQQAQDAALAQAQQQIDAFRDAKGPDGKPLHPHFAALENEILTLAQGIRATGRPVNLEEVYQHAVWMNPTTREVSLKAERDKAAKAADSTAVAGQRKKAAAVNMPKTNVGQASRPAKGKTIEETMRMRVEALGYGQDD